MTRLIFVRHGESDHSFGAAGDRGLTSVGRQQAVRLADSLAAVAPVAVYSSALRRAAETARPIAEAAGVSVAADCGLCTWHMPADADDGYQTSHAVAGGGVFRPFEEGNESWAELVVRVGRAVMDVAHRHPGGTVVLVGHTETVESSFHVLGGQPLYRAFDLAVAPASVTEWTTGGDPTGWPPPRWTLRRFNAIV